MTKNTTSPQSQKNDWEEMFDKKFGQEIFDLFLNDYDIKEFSNPSAMTHAKMNEIKQFISTLLDKQVEEMTKAGIEHCKVQIEGMANEMIGEELDATFVKFDDGIILDYEMQKGYNYKRKQIINIAKKYI